MLAVMHYIDSYYIRLIGLFHLALFVWSNNAALYKWLYGKENKLPDFFKVGRADLFRLSSL